MASLPRRALAVLLLVSALALGGQLRAPTPAAVASQPVTVLRASAAGPTGAGGPAADPVGSSARDGGHPAVASSPDSGTAGAGGRDGRAIGLTGAVTAVLLVGLLASFGRLWAARRAARRRRR